MEFLVIPAPTVWLAVERLGAVSDDYFRTVVISRLEERPFPDPASPLIEQRRDENGQRFFVYEDHVLPLAFNYRVFEPDVDYQRGFIWIRRATPVDR